MKKQIYISACLLMIFSMTACDKDNKPQTTYADNEVTNTLQTDGDYQIWNKYVLNSTNVIGKNRDSIQPIYNKTFAYNPQEFGTDWIISMAQIATNNNAYKQSVLDYAGNDTKSLAVSIINNPQIATRFTASRTAFIEILSQIAKNDEKYRLLSSMFEASARGKTLPRYVDSKKIPNLTFAGYLSNNRAKPSVIERILAVSALDILRGDNKSLYNKEITNLQNNQAISNCLAMAKRNSDQCNAASYDNHDLSFCMARHNIAEVSKCMSWLLP